MNRYLIAYTINDITSEGRDSFTTKFCGIKSEVVLGKSAQDALFNILNKYSGDRKFGEVVAVSNLDG